MNKYLWRWNVTKDCWELITTAAADKTKIVLRNYRRRDKKGIRFKWTDSDVSPKRFRTRVKKGDTM